VAVYEQGGRKVLEANGGKKKKTSSQDCSNGCGRKGEGKTKGGLHGGDLAQNWAYGVISSCLDYLRGKEHNRGGGGGYSNVWNEIRKRDCREAKLKEGNPLDQGGKKCVGGITVKKIQLKS